MKGSVFIAISGAAAAMAAGPLVKKNLEVKYVTNIVYKTVTEGDIYPSTTCDEDVYPAATKEAAVVDYTPEETYVPQETYPDQPTYPAAAVDSQPTDYSSTCTYHHNAHRSNHSAPAVSWSEEYASYAAQSAASCKFAHDL